MIFENYINDITSGVKNIIVTNQKGEIISVQEGMETYHNKIRSMRDTYNGTMFFCGNGASATMADHMAQDWFKNAQIRTQTCMELAYLTATGNDFSYDELFSYKLNRIMTSHDVLVTISSSGNSKNIVNAIKEANQKGAFVITFSGMEPDNNSRKFGNLNFYVPLNTYGLVESAHAVLLHSILDIFIESDCKEG